MIDPKKKQMIEELIAHLEHSQGRDLAGLMDEAKAKPMDGLEPSGEASPLDVMGPDKDKDPALEVSKVSVIPGADEADKSLDPMASPGEDEPSDEELAEMLKRFL